MLIEVLLYDDAGCHGEDTLSTYRIQNDVENPSWAGHKEEDGHQRDGFMVFFMRLADYKDNKSIPRVTICLLIDKP